MPKRRNGRYTTTTIEVREDLMLLCDKRKWNRRKLLEEKLLSMVTPEDLAFMEATRLEKELDEKKRLLEKTTMDGVKI